MRYWFQKYEPSVLLLKDRHGYFELSPESENMLISILLWITEVKKWYDLDFLTSSSGTSSWTVGSSSMMSSMLSLFPPSWLTMYFQYIYFFHFCSTILCSEVFFRRFKTLFYPQHYCSHSSQQKHYRSHLVFEQHILNEVSQLIWLEKSDEYLFFSYCIDLKTSF